MLALCSGVLGLVACSKSDDAKSADSAPAASAQQSVQAGAPLKCEAGPDGHCKASASCSPTCQQVATPDCIACEETGDCFEFVNNCTDPALSEAEQALCYDLMSCVQTSNCFDDKGSLGSCYCGSLPLQQCLKAPMTGVGAPDGVCRELILRGMPQATTQQQVLALMTMKKHPTGHALSRLQCQKVGVSSMCSERCGFGKPTGPKPLPSQPR